MKRKTLALIVLLSLGAPACSNAPTGDAVPPDSLEQRASYALGFSAGQSLSAQGTEIDIDQLVAGLRAALAGEEGRMTADEMQATMMVFQQRMAAEETARTASAGTANKAAGDAFLAENANKPRVVVLDSGLQYEVLTEGDGASAVLSDEITAHYEGRLIDGTVFDSSIEKGIPMTIELSVLVPGFIEGIKLMKVGSKYRLFIPGELGYGARGGGAMIGPNTTLIFDVELLAINGQS